MTAGNVFFALCSLVCLVGALATVMAANPIRGAVGLLATIMGIAGLFLQLNAQFLAAIQLIVYAGAVVVLFVFVIMLLGPDAGVGAAVVERSRVSRGVSASIMVVLTLAAFAALVRLGPKGVAKAHVFEAASPGHGSVEAVGQQLFTRAIVPFELATALLIVAVVGAIAVARSRPHSKKPSAEPNPNRRFYHGPVHPRDELPVTPAQTAKETGS
jgi:NADH-quinone oxidoreductase subunit J